MLENYQASADSQILLRIENENQIDGFYDPVLLATVSTTNLPTMPSATFTGITEESQMSIRFSDQVGNYSSAEYSFKITNGAGDVYADFAGSGLNVFNTISEAEIKDAVLQALSVRVTNLSQTDSSFEHVRMGCVSEWGPPPYKKQKGTSYSHRKL